MYVTGIAARRAADGTLIDQDHVVDLAVAEHVVERQRFAGVLAFAAAQRRIERVLHQRALARPADAGDQTQHAQREIDRDVLQVVAACPGQTNPAVCRLRAEFPVSPFRDARVRYSPVRL